MDESSEEPQIFSTDEGAVMIKSRAKMRIIELLKEGEKTGRELRDSIGKAKSTISVHLSDLKELGVIKEKDHPDDKRVKIFFLSSKLVGKSEEPYDRHYREILKNLQGSGGDEYEFLKSLFHLIRYGLISFGLDIHPALKEIGRDAGKSIGQGFTSESEEGVLKEIADFWKDTRLGTIEADGIDHLVIEDCFDCDTMPEVGHTLCSLDEGIMEGIIEEKLDEEITVTEVECHGTGADHCRFELRWDQP